MKFKYILTFAIVFFIGIQLNAQTAKKKKPKKKKKADTESVYAYVDSLPLPDKFKNESIVILGHYEKMKIISPGTNFKLPGKAEDQVSSHYLMDVFSITRFLLQDLNAVGKFSTYYFSESEVGNKQITIIKKNGERNEVDLTKAISVKETISNDILELSFGKYKKIALPGLEVGDMIEFSGREIGIAVNTSTANQKITYGTYPIDDYLSESSYSYSGRSYQAARYVAVSYIFPPALLGFYPHLFAVSRPTNKRVRGVSVPEFLVHLNKVYPVVKQGYDVETPVNNLPLEYTLLNGASKPEFKSDETTQSMHIESENNDAVAQEFFNYENNNVPSVRYTFNLKSFEKFNMHFNNTDGRGFDDAAAAMLARRLVKSKWKADAITKMYNFDKTDGKKIGRMDNAGKLKYFYYYYKKNYALISYILSKGEDMTYESSMAATKFFQLFCDRNKIPYEIVMWLGRAAGPTKTAVSGDKLRWGIVAHPGGKDIYITDFDAYSEYNVPHQTMYGAEVFYVNPAKKYSVKSEKFDAENDRNKMIVKTTGKISADGTGLALSSDFVIKGELKNDNFNLVASRSDFYKYYETILGGMESEEDDVKYLDLYYYSSDFKDKAKQDAEEKRLTSAIEKNFEQNENEKYREYLEGQYNQDAEVEKAEINSKGLTNYKAEEPEAIGFSVDYTLEHTVNSIGNGAMVIDLGRLMSEQIEFKDLSDRTRKNAIDVNFRKEFDYTITLNIPAGFKSANLTDFNTNVDNEICSFVATAKEENGMVIFHCVKTYKVVHAETSDWPKMTEVMDAAAMMFQKKLLLEKQN